MRFPLRRQQQAETGSSGAPAPIPFPAVSAAPPIPTSPGQAPPAPPLTLRGQLNGADARAERLIRQVRDDVERLQDAFGALGAGHADLMEADPASITANPEAAAALGPAVLVRAIVSSQRQNRRLRKQLARARQRERELTSRLLQLEIDDAARRSRLETIEDVLAALHGNLQDLRAERAFLHSLTPGLAQPNRPGLPPGEAPR